MSKIQQSMKKAQAGHEKSSRSTAGFAVSSRPVSSCGSCSPWPAATPLATDHGYMYRVDAKDTVALGFSNPATAQASGIQERPFSGQKGSTSDFCRCRYVIVSAEGMTPTCSQKRPLVKHLRGFGCWTLLRRT